MKTLFGFILAFFLSLAPLHAQVLEQTFSDTDSGFRISTPSGEWHLEPRGVDPGPLRTTMRFESAVNQFVPNVTVRVSSLDDPETKADQVLKEDMAAFPPSIEILEKKKLKVGEVPGFELLLLDPTARRVFHQRFFVAKGKSFVITCTADKESYSRMLRDFQKILDSFAIL